MGRKEGVVLYSGGMDSLILARMFPSYMRLYVNTNSKYARKEIANLPPGVVVDNTVDLGPWERDDAIVPGRNAFLALTGSLYGDKILLGATAGDLSRDKDDTWARQLTELCRYMYSGKHFTPNWDVEVRLPIKGYAKCQLVKAFLHGLGGTRDELLQCISCYDPELHQCGVCKACRRKWIALEYNGVKCSQVFDTFPEQADWSHEISILSTPGAVWRNSVEDASARKVLSAYGLATF